MIRSTPSTPWTPVCRRNYGSERDAPQEEAVDDGDHRLALSGRATCGVGSAIVLSNWYVWLYCQIWRTAAGGAHETRRNWL